MGLRGPWPALLTSTSMRPQRESVPSMSRFRSSVDWLDPVTPKPPSSLASASPLPEEERIAILKPSAASRRADAAPMPLPPAVRTATFSPAISASLKNDSAPLTPRRNYCRRTASARLNCGAPVSCSDQPARFEAQDFRMADDQMIMDADIERGRRLNNLKRHVDI